MKIHPIPIRGRKVWLEIPASWGDSIPMTVVVSKSDNRQLRSEIPAMKKAAKRIASTPDRARKFLIDNGFMTKKSGKLTKRYGG